MLVNIDKIVHWTYIIIITIVKFLAEVQNKEKVVVMSNNLSVVFQNDYLYNKSG